MTGLIALWAMGLLHAGFAGGREAAGLNFCIRKRTYYVRAALRGVLVGQVASMIIGAVLLSVWLGEGDAVLESLGGAAKASLWIYVPYAATVMLAFVPYLVRHPDLRSLTMVMIFGPLTLALPAVILVGTIVGVLAAPSFQTGIVMGTGALAIALVEPALVLGRWSKKAAETEHERVGQSRD